MGADSVNCQRCTAGNVNGCTVTSINQLKAISDAVNVYPNPASNNVQISFTDNSGEITHINMYDVNGKLVLSQTINNNTIDVSNLPEGVYNVSIISNLTTTGINKKLVIVR
jgi:hypothetical protein